MVARKYDYNYEFNGIERTREREQRKAEQRQRRLKVLRNRALVILACLLGTYFLAVLRSEYLFTQTTKLGEMKKIEAELLLKTAQAKIAVEQLNGPTRITAIAQNKLGMQVARNNIYVQSGRNKIAYDGYAYAR